MVRYAKKWCVMGCYNDKLISLKIKGNYDKMCGKVLGCDMLDMLTLNQRVWGSNPSAPTSVFHKLRCFSNGFAAVVHPSFFSIRFTILETGPWFVQ